MSKFIKWPYLVINTVIQPHQALSAPCSLCILSKMTWFQVLCPYLVYLLTSHVYLRTYRYVHFNLLPLSYSIKWHSNHCFPVLHLLPISYVCWPLIFQYLLRVCTHTIMIVLLGLPFVPMFDIVNWTPISRILSMSPLVRLVNLDSTCQQHNKNRNSLVQSTPLIEGQHLRLLTNKFSSSSTAIFRLLIINRTNAHSPLVGRS